MILIAVSTITIWPGERVDFVLKANQRVDNYWIRFKGFGLCEPTNTTSGIYQVAILRYSGAPATDPASPIGYDVSPETHLTKVNLW